MYQQLQWAQSIDTNLVKIEVEPTLQNTSNGTVLSSAWKRVESKMSFDIFYDYNQIMVLMILPLIQFSLPQICNCIQERLKKNTFCVYSCTILTRISNPPFRLSLCPWNLLFKVHSMEWKYPSKICEACENKYRFFAEANNPMWTMPCNTSSQPGLQRDRQWVQVLCHN